MSQAIQSFGTFLKTGDGASPENFTTIAEVMNINGLQMSAKIDDITTHSSGVPWRAKLATLLDGGTVTFDINFIPTEATHSFSVGVLKDFSNRTKRNFKLVFPDGGSTTWDFSGYYQDFKPTAPVDGVLKAAITIAVNGQPTLRG